jgi:hypothetical protein
VTHITPPIRKAFTCFLRNGRWGTCSGCPKSGDGSVYPEFCDYTSRNDHQLDLKSLMEMAESEDYSHAERLFKHGDGPDPGPRFKKETTA